MQEQRFILMTSFLVALIGGPAVYSVVKEPAVLRENRSPASISSNPANSAAKIDLSNRRSGIQSKSVVLDYNCKGTSKDPESKVHEVDGTLLRVRGSTCLDEKWKNVSITNQTNGFTGSVLFLKNNKFTTDFIDLVEGENRLAFLATNEKGQPVTKTLIVKRRAPAAAQP